MSFHAVSWAIKQRAGSPSAKSVLWSIASYASDEWCCFPKQETISRDSEQSIDSVQRRLVDLIEQGLVRRLKLKRFGRRTHDFFILQPSPYFAASLDQVLMLLPTSCDVMDDSANAAADCGSGNDAHQKEQATEQPSEFAGAEAENAAADCGHVTLPQSADDATALVRQHEYNSELRDSPPTPLRGAGPSEAAEKRFQEFKSNYPDGIVDLEMARREYFALADPDQVACNVGVLAYAARCRKRREKSMKAHLFVRKHGWSCLVASAAGPGIAPASYEPQSPTGRALLMLAAIARHSPLVLSNGQISYRHPVTDRLLAMTQAPSETQWARYERGSQQFAAWREFISETFAGWALPLLSEVTAPWPWPPRKDGTIQVALTTLATEEDAEEFARSN